MTRAISLFARPDASSVSTFNSWPVSPSVRTAASLRLKAGP